MNNECYTCLSQSGERPIFPEARMYDGAYWRVGHAYPVGIKGWLIIALKRHVEALHELEPEEFKELATLTTKFSRALKQSLNCEKEYLMCFAEGEHFNHIHFHLVAKPANLPAESKGPNIFTKLRVSEAEAYNRDELIKFCQRIKEIMPD